MQKVYQIKRSNRSSALADAIVVVASKANNSENDSSRTTLDDMIGYIKIEASLYPSTNRGVVVTKVNDYHIIVDQESNFLLEIIEVELYDNVPTLDVYKKDNLN